MNKGKLLNLYLMAQITASLRSPSQFSHSGGVTLLVRTLHGPSGGEPNYIDRCESADETEQQMLIVVLLA